jgi:predicted PP-loop superfamily ATPase
MNFSVTNHLFNIFTYEMKTKLDCLKLINFIEKSIDFKKIFYPAKNILIAYSGGQDSSALLAYFIF